MFRVLVVLTTLLFFAEGAFELTAMDQPLGWALISIGALVAFAGSLAAPYATERERRRRGES